MEIGAKILFFLCGFIVVWAMIGYPLSLKIIGKLYNRRKIEKNYFSQPTVTVIVAAHNEEKVILSKLNNILELEYPSNKIELLVASDNSTDKTNEIVRELIKEHPERKIRLYEVTSRKGKTNAQNEAQKVVDTEYIVFTDANSMMDKRAVAELMSAFTSEDIAYVSGRLLISNQDESLISGMEASYWDSDITLREIEGRIQTITAGNGAIYACRTKDYVDFDPIECHDSAMPVYYALQGKRAIANHDAVAFEKAGENIKDEFKRKVRMNRVILRHILPDIRILNVFKYRWFSCFYLGHRTCRYLLWIGHLILLVANAVLIGSSWFFAAVMIGQALFYILAVLGWVTKAKAKVLTLMYYYVMTIAAQWAGVFNTLFGKARPYWEKAESTR